MTEPATPQDSLQAKLRDALAALKRARGGLEELERRKREPIAIIGMGCRYPGGANDPAGLWQLAAGGATGIAAIPPERWALEDFYNPDPEAPGTYVSKAGFCAAPLAEFDAGFFGIPPREAAEMDGQQRLALEVSWEALEHAGVEIDRLAGSRTGVFLGVGSSDHSWLALSDAAGFTPYTGVGSSCSTTVGRIAHLLDLRGPTLAIDTACSSALVALHMAVSSLRAGECDLALAGGVYLITTPLPVIALSKLRLFSRDGSCRPFAAGADGTVPAEGCGMLVLKRASDARRDGDRILALVRGSAINQNGRSAGITAPNLLAQKEVLAEALKQAGVAASEVGLIEAFGTGTPLGDQVEFEALAMIYGEGSASENPCYITSVKSNIGHAMNAAGAASLVKTVESLAAGEIAPIAGFGEPGEQLDWRATRLRFAHRAQPWPRQEGRSRLAAVSSFSWSGSNVHVILEEGPAPVEEGAAVAPRLLTLSARSPQALAEVARRWARYLGPQGQAESFSLEDIAFTASARRKHHDHRLALVGSSREQLAVKLERLLAEGAFDEARFPRVAQLASRPLVLVFPAEQDRAEALYALAKLLPAVATHLEACEAAAAEVLGLAGLSPSSEGAPSPLAAAARSLASQTALVVALSELGIQASAAVGGGVGEAAAAWAAGLLSLPQAFESLRPLAAGGSAERFGPLPAVTAGVTFFSASLGTMVSAAEIAAGRWQPRPADSEGWAMALGALSAETFNTYLELAPDPEASAALGCLRTLAGGGVTRLALLPADACPAECLLEALGTLYGLGFLPRFARLFSPGRQAVTVPAYPWQREPCLRQVARPKAVERGPEAGVAEPSGRPGVAEEEKLEFRRLWETTSGAERQSVVEMYLRAQVGTVLGLAEERVEVDRPLVALGLDSLMAVELRKRLEDLLGLELPMALLASAGSLAELARPIDQRLETNFPTVLQASVGPADWEEFTL
ncbi:MAG: beta-ketoacyl synthase N-terminal-like domain-containing protein [Thermoanaerobaculia bacterium]